MKLRVLCTNRHYLPGYKFGGSVRSIDNIVEHLGDEFEFLVITTDRDIEDTAPYPGMQVGGWNKVGKAQVYYLDPSRRTLGEFARLLRETPHDVLYLNSFFDPMFTQKLLLARRLGMAPEKPCVLATRGEFSEGAFKLKGLKKKLFVAAASLLGLYRGIIWQASTRFEADDIRRVMGKGTRNIRHALDLPIPVSGFSSQGPERVRLPGEPLKLVFLSRIHPKKNLDYALRALAHVRVPVEYNVYGPFAGEEEYWATCQALIAALPSNVKVQYRGWVSPAGVPGAMAENDLFFFPTRGENYGHVIAEAISVGTPVLLADTTPWRNLEELGVGWDLPLEDPRQFALRIEECAAKSPEEMAAWRGRVRAFAEQKLTDPSAVEENRRLFADAASQR